MGYDKYIQDLVKREGGYVDHPNDRGGPTNWGITQAVARAHGWKGEMRDLSQGLAVEIYIRRYWTEPKFSEVERISAKVAEELLDTGVNMGTQWPVKFLQRSLNVLNLRQKMYPDLEVDGRIGLMTLDALRQFVNVRGAAGVAVLMRLLEAQQALRYVEICEANSLQEDFMFGWVAHRIQNVEY